MSLLNFLQFQTIDKSRENLGNHLINDDIDLFEQLDEGALESFWDKVVLDIHDDPEWFNFS